MRKPHWSQTVPDVYALSDAIYTQLTNQNDLLVSDSDDENTLKGDIQSVLRTLTKAKQFDTNAILKGMAKKDMVETKAIPEIEEYLKPVIQKLRDEQEAFQEPDPTVQVVADPGPVPVPSMDEPTASERPAVTITAGPPIKDGVRVFTDVPPPATHRRHTGYPWNSIEVHQAFFIPYAKRSSINTSCSHQRKRLGKTFICREWQVDGVEGVMVWRMS